MYFSRIKEAIRGYSAQSSTIAQLQETNAKLSAENFRMEKELKEIWTDVRDGLPNIESEVLIEVKRYSQKYFVSKYDKVFNDEFIVNAICMTEHVIRWRYLS